MKQIKIIRLEYSKEIDQIIIRFDRKLLKRIGQLYFSFSKIFKLINQIFPFILYNIMYQYLSKTLSTLSLQQQRRFLVRGYQITHSKEVCQQIMEKQNIKQFDAFFQKRIKILSNRINENQDKNKSIIQPQDLSNLIKKQEIPSYIDELIKKRKYFDAYRFMKAFQYSKIAYKELINILVNEEEVLAVKIMNEQKIKLNNMQFQILQEKLQSESFNYFAFRKDLPYQKIEELFANQKKLMLYFIKLKFEKMPDEMMSIDYRLKLTKDCDTRNILQTNKYIPNKLLTEDQFLPSEIILNHKKSQDFIKLSDFGISESDIILIENQEELTEQIMTSILSSKMTGIDTESSGEFPTTKLSKQPQLCLLQIALNNKIYLFNTLNLIDSEKYQSFIESYLSGDVMKIGQSISIDLNILQNQIQKKQVNVNSILDLNLLFKENNQHVGKSSLAYQCTHFLGKQLCKIEQMSYWDRRPLRKAQIHYAALDAYICLHIYQQYYQCK